MLDIQLIRNDRDAVAAALAKRMDADELTQALDAITELDATRRSLVQNVDAARAARNARAKEIGQAKREGRELTFTGELPDPADFEAQLREVDEQLRDAMSRIPNLPADDVVAGGKEANRVVRTSGEKPAVDPVIPHWELASKLGLVDFKRGAALSGSGFWIYTGVGAQLEWALINYFISRNLAAGYTMIMPPHLVLPAAGRAAGQFPRFADDVYHTNDPSGLFLIPTAETAIVGAYAEETFREKDLPFKAFAYTPCYRRERAGSHSDERGTVRGHQFNKVEIFQFVTPGQAQQAMEEMVAHVESVVTGLGLHHRTSLLAASDASSAMKRTLDVEVWIPSTGAYKEVSSVSWAGDYQARRAGIRYKGANKGYVETLNGSALATSRVFPAMLEHWQQPDGSLVIPDVLRPFMGGLERVTPPA